MYEHPREFLMRLLLLMILTGDNDMIHALSCLSDEHTIRSILGGPVCWKPEQLANGHGNRVGYYSADNLEVPRGHFPTIRS